MRFFITGGAGFIGSNLADRLLSDNHEVIVYDNFSTGFTQFLSGALSKSKFTEIKGDILDDDKLVSSMRGCNHVFHLAANADVRFGLQNPDKDLNQNTIGTYHILEAMRKNGIKKISFSSTGSVYGEALVIPTPEDAPFPVQTSLYGASKLACEGLIEAYCEGFGFQSWIFRFVSILGERYTHGHVFDFYKKLLSSPEQLEVLGDGKQRKSYLYVQDCIEAMLIAMKESDNKINIFNLGTDEYCMVDDSIRWITAELNLSPAIRYTGGKKGWVGDNPFIFLDTKKIRSLGWRPRNSIKDSIKKTLHFLKDNQWVLQRE